MHEKPSWFTADLIARIPNEFIPKRYLDALNQAAGGQRRSTVDMGTVELLAVPAVQRQAWGRRDLKLTDSRREKLSRVHASATFGLDD